MAMIVRKEIHIDAPLDVVWAAFSRLEEWSQWNRVCTDCCYLEGRELTVDACFAFTITPLFFPLRVTPRIVLCDPGREVVWQGGKFGVQAVHRFLFSEENGGVHLLSEETFSGPLLVAGLLLRVPQRLHKLTETFMEGIKAYAEACAGKARITPP
jgi:hypothetical protein